MSIFFAAESRVEAEDKEVDLTLELCSVIEEYKENYEQAEREITELQGVVELLYGEHERLVASEENYKLAVHELEEALCHLDQETTRAHSLLTEKDEELQNLRNELSEAVAATSSSSGLTAQEQSDFNEKELLFLRKERKRLLDLTEEQSLQLDEYEQSNKRQYAEIQELSKKCSELQKREKGGGSGKNASSASSSPRSRRRPLPADSHPVSPASAAAVVAAAKAVVARAKAARGEGGRGEDASMMLTSRIYASDEGGHDDSDEGDDEGTRHSLLRASPSPGKDKQGFGKTSPSSKKWSDGKKHVGLYKEITLPSSATNNPTFNMSGSANHTSNGGSSSSRWRKEDLAMLETTKEERKEEEEGGEFPFTTTKHTSAISLYRRAAQALKGKGSTNSGSGANVPTHTEVPLSESEEDRANSQLDTVSGSDSSARSKGEGSRNGSRRFSFPKGFVAAVTKKKTTIAASPSSPSSSFTAL